MKNSSIFVGGGGGGGGWGYGYGEDGRKMHLGKQKGRYTQEMGVTFESAFKLTDSKIDR